MNCDDSSYCHAPLDCTVDYGFLDSCTHWYCWNECDQVETCEYQIAGQGHEAYMTCEEFNDFLHDMSGDDDTCELNCFEPYDCADRSGLAHCMETFCEKTCDGYAVESCNVHFEHGGEMMDADCDEFWSHVNNQTNGTDDCKQCQKHHDCAEDLNLDKCEVLTCFDVCTEEADCIVKIADMGMDMEMYCDDFIEEFEIDLDDQDCEICHKEDCRNETGLAHCEWSQCFNGCTMEDHCFVHFKADREDQDMHKMQCDAFHAMMEGECVDVVEHGSCKEDLEMHIDDVKRCNYTVGFNTCEEEEEWCHVEVKVGDEEFYFDDCEEAQSHFDLPDCEDVMSEEGDCLEDV